MKELLRGLRNYLKGIVIVVKDTVVSKVSTDVLDKLNTKDK